MVALGECRRDSLGYCWFGGVYLWGEIGEDELFFLEQMSGGADKIEVNKIIRDTQRVDSQSPPIIMLS